MNLMQEKTLQPSAEEKSKPQKKKNTLSKKEKTDKSHSKIISRKKESKISTEKIKENVIEDKSKELKKTINVDEKGFNEKITDYSKYSLDKLLKTLDEICNDNEWLKNHEHIKQIGELYEKKFQIEVDKQRKIFLKGGGNEIDFFFKPDYKTKFDQISFDYRKKRRDYYKNLEATKKINLERKIYVIEEIKKLIDQNQIDPKTYKSFRTLQESWYKIGQVPRSESQNIWETFKHHVERFYAFLHLDREFRDLDYKHNYDEKLKIIEKAEALENTTDILKASRDLNILHQKWKNDLGPVAKEHRESLWLRFQKASKVIQTKRQEYQKNKLGLMQENLIKKNGLLKDMKNIINEIPDNHKGWQNTLKKFNLLREEFKKIGYVPAKDSKTSWKSFREYGTEFMRKKNAFYKEQKKIFSKNINEKKEIIDFSKKILESDNWDTCVEEMKNTQKKWKNVGFIPRRIENKLWIEFSEIQKVYFDRLKKGYKRITSEQEMLLEEKKLFLNKIEKSQLNNSVELIQNQLNEYLNTWSNLGTLDRKNESKNNQLFFKCIISKVKKVDLEKDELKDILKIINTKMFEYDSNLLDIKYEGVKNELSDLKGELTQLENNLEFFSNSSTENPLFKNVEKQIKSCEKKIEKLHEEHIYLKQIKTSKSKSANGNKTIGDKNKSSEDLKTSSASQS